MFPIIYSEKTKGINRPRACCTLKLRKLVYLMSLYPHWALGKDHYIHKLSLSCPSKKQEGNKPDGVLPMILPSRPEQCCNLEQLFSSLLHVHINFKVPASLLHN